MVAAMATSTSSIISRMDMSGTCAPARPTLGLALGFWNDDERVSELRSVMQTDVTSGPPTQRNDDTVS